MNIDRTSPAPQEASASLSDYAMKQDLDGLRAIQNTQIDKTSGDGILPALDLLKDGDLVAPSPGPTGFVPAASNNPLAYGPKLPVEADAAAGSRENDMRPPASKSNVEAR